jgi:hypothetical protein
MDKYYALDNKSSGNYVLLFESYCEGNFITRNLVRQRLAVKAWAIRR